MVHEVNLKVEELGDLVLIGKRKNLTPREVWLVPPQIALYAAGPVQLFDLYLVIKHDDCFIFMTCSNSKKPQKFTYSAIVIVLNQEGDERCHKPTRKCDLCTTWKKVIPQITEELSYVNLCPHLSLK